jgi:hypothetical protein
VTLRSTALGGLGILIYSPDPGAFVFPNPLLPIVRVGLPFTIAAAGPIDGTGRFLVVTQLDASIPAGTTVVGQGIVFAGAGKWYASQAVELTVGGQAATFSDDTASLDPATGLYASADVDWIDVDRDGDPDVLVANDGTGAQPLVLVNDAGGFDDESAARLPSSARVPTSCVEAGDVDGDGDEDLFLGGGSNLGSPAANLLLSNDGTGSFSLSGGFPAGAGLTIDAEFGDVDGDEDLDLVLANKQDLDHPTETPDPVVLYVNQGGLQGGATGSFIADAPFSSLPGNGPHGDDGDVSLGDADNDGDLDLFVCRSSIATLGAQNQLYLNDGTGGFADVTASALPVLADNSFEADFGDFDGNGFLDLFVANSISSQPNAVHLLLNQGPIGPGGTPVFSDGSANVPASLGTASNVRISTDVGDIEGDGDLDVVVGVHQLFDSMGNPGGYTALLVNQAGLQAGVQGVFALDATFTSTELFVDADVALADYDLDGDLDVYVANRGDLFQINFEDELLRNDL